jgi:hypothetical protein
VGVPEPGGDALLAGPANVLPTRTLAVVEATRQSAALPVPDFVIAHRVLLI